MNKFAYNLITLLYFELMGIILAIICCIMIVYGIGYYVGEKHADKNLERYKKNLEKQFSNAQSKLYSKFEALNAISSCHLTFQRVATLYADLKTYVYDEIAYGLCHGYRPAFKAADEVKEAKRKAKTAIEQHKIMQYKYEFLLNQFPTLREYVDDDEALQESLNNCYTIDDASNLHDRVKDWISEEDYKHLDIDVRNQKALDNWIKGKKLTNTQVGYDYELYVGYLYRKDGWEVIQHGIDRGLEDMGRDVIAKKMIDGRLTIHIIQCKRWSKNKSIHENIITQLYGTSIQYILAHNIVPGCKVDVIPILFTTAPLSKTAQDFANYLKVIVNVVKMGDYPRIKCNINKSTGEKIYHLPFDQQYYTAKIDQPGEFYAFTIKEATSKGFRRAFRYIQK